MQRFRLKHLFLSSILAFAFGHCSPLRGYKYAGKTKVDKLTVLPVTTVRQPLLYRATIDLYNKHYSGLLLFKRTDAETEHITFVTEVGMKMFDYEIRDSSFNLVYIFEPLNSPKLIKLLSDDLSLMVLHDLYQQESATYTKEREYAYLTTHKLKYYYFVDQNKVLTKIVVKGKLRKKIFVSYSADEDQSPAKIVLRHSGLVRLRMNLQRITKLEP